MLSAVEFSEHHNRRLAPITVQRITMVVFAAWLREQDPDETTMSAAELAEAFESAARCARALTGPDVRALQSTLVDYADRTAREAGGVPSAA